MIGRTSVYGAIALGIMLLTVDGASAQESSPYPLPPAEWPEPIQDDAIWTFLMVDRLEYRAREGKDTRNWDVQGWIGTDYDKLWLKTEGEDVIGGKLERVRLEALYARRVAPFWYLQAGLRHDPRPRPSRSFAALGVQGLGLYWFELEATVYVSDEGDLSARLEAEYDILLTQRMVLQPRLETNVAASDVPELSIGQGFNDISLGLRLRYEIRREFAPYIGIVWSRQLGETADFARRDGEDVESTAFVAGLRMWF